MWLNLGQRNKLLSETGYCRVNRGGLHWSHVAIVVECRTAAEVGIYRARYPASYFAAQPR
jgi:hypothetical protein